MKSLFICVVSCLTSFAVFAQTGANTVTINLTGNRNREVVVDQRKLPCYRHYRKQHNRCRRKFHCNPGSSAWPTYTAGCSH